MEKPLRVKFHSRTLLSWILDLLYEPSGLRQKKLIFFICPPLVEWVCVLWILKGLSLTEIVESKFYALDGSFPLRVVFVEPGLVVIGRVTEKVDIQDFFCLEERRVMVCWIYVKKRHNVSSTLVLAVRQVVIENLRPRGIQSLQDKKTAAIQVIY